jgi:prepilin peptidase CpaA
MDPIQTSVLAGFLVLAVTWDLLERRIPNELVAAFAVAGVALNAASPADVASAVSGFALGLGLLLVPFALGMVGAGDAKFFAAVGTYLGPTLIFHALLLGLALGGVFALAYRWRERRGALGPAATIPYAIPLALGAVAALACRWAGIPVL